MKLLLFTGLFGLTLAQQTEYLNTFYFNENAENPCSEISLVQSFALDTCIYVNEGNGTFKTIQRPDPSSSQIITTIYNDGDCLIAASDPDFSVAQTHGTCNYELFSLGYPVFTDLGQYVKSVRGPQCDQEPYAVTWIPNSGCMTEYEGLCLPDETNWFSSQIQCTGQVPSTAFPVEYYSRPHIEALFGPLSAYANRTRSPHRFSVDRPKGFIEISVDDTCASEAARNRVTVPTGVCIPNPRIFDNSSRYVKMDVTATKRNGDWRAFSVGFNDSHCKRPIDNNFKLTLSASCIALPYFAININFTPKKTPHPYGLTFRHYATTDCKVGHVDVYARDNVCYNDGSGSSWVADCQNDQFTYFTGINCGGETATGSISAQWQPTYQSCSPIGKRQSLVVVCGGSPPM